MLWRYFFHVLWSIWWGGLTFYAVVVVPIGTKLIGSVEQGFITQHVTQWHNAIAGAFVFCLLAEARRRRSRILFSLGAALALIEVMLVAWHVRLTGMMNFDLQTVPDRFYAEHAVYLWITAAEWAIGVAIPFWLLEPLTRSANEEPSD